ncbi:MAG: TfoX/Sxy family protein [Candidatus Pacebacteria bacterium]|nr:TfoX/Sxy family protein [Candidatus Paceibacterota bacterium]
MKTTPFLEYVLYDLFGEGEPVTWRAMMGAYMLYCEGKPFAIVEDDELYFKGSKETKDWYLKRRSRQFTYEKKGENAYLYYFFVPEEVYEDRELFKEWVEVACALN